MMMAHAFFLLGVLGFLGFVNLFVMFLRTVL